MSIEKNEFENKQNLDHKSHSCSADTDHDREVPETDLFAPLQIRGLTLKNRIVMSPMCQYSAEDGFANDWHLVHLGSRAAGGNALIMVEATAVTSQGRISPGDLGLWDQSQIDPLKKITQFVHSQGSLIGIQLAHAGRKGSCDLPWKGGAKLSVDQGGWEVMAPSSIPFSSTDPLPRTMTEADIETVINAFEKAAQYALKANFNLIEIHSAHGYLLHEFLSPLANQRTDQYGGSLENRMRFLLCVVERIRRCIPEQMPLFVRISATDWMDNGWDLTQSIALAKKLKEAGVDLIDVSSGGMVPKANIPIEKGYQVPFASAIRNQAKIKTAAVGLITDVQQANEIVTSGDADLVFLGREMLREPYWALKAEHAIDNEVHWPIQYGYAVKRKK